VVCGWSRHECYQAQRAKQQQPHDVNELVDEFDQQKNESQGNDSPGKRSKPVIRPEAGKSIHRNLNLSMWNSSPRHSTQRLRMTSWLMGSANAEPGECITEPKVNQVHPLGFAA
jgi:hypothetical protein